MIINKITEGYVLQRFDTVTRSFVGQEFVAGEVEYEDAEVWKSVVGDRPPYLPFEMIQPRHPLEQLADCAEDKQ